MANACATVEEQSGFVEGHGFSRAASDLKENGL
jgi:hypothetical protein